MGHYETTSSVCISNALPNQLSKTSVDHSLLPSRTLEWQWVSTQTQRKRYSLIRPPFCSGGCVGCAIKRQTLSKGDATKRGRRVFTKRSRKSFRSSYRGDIHSI